MSKNIYDIENAKYRTFFFSAKNKYLTEKCQQLDYEFMLNYIFAEYEKHIELFNDEYVENRYGLKKIIDLLKYIGKDKKILDVGCGNCELCLHLEKMGFYCCGLDASPHRVLRNRARFRRVFFGFSENMPFDDGEFQVIICTECLEHVVSVDISLQEISRVCADGGMIIIQVPNKNLVESDNHIRLFSQSSLRGVVQKYFRIISIDIIPYLNGEKSNNIFCICKKN